MESKAYTYILECADGTLYTGWTTDLERRVREHNGKDGKGAKYTRTRQPCRLAYFEEYADKVEAMQREWEIKNRLSRRDKMALIAGKGSETLS